MPGGLERDLNNRLVHRDQFGAIRKSGFHLDVRNHLGHAVHHIGSRQHVAPCAHELGHGFAVPGTFHDGSADQRQGFRVVELQPTAFAALGQQGRRKDEQLVFFTRS